MEDHGTRNVVIGVVGFILLVGLLFWLWPTYNVWASGLSGQAKLREAEYSRKVAIEEAKANLESEKLNADAELVRAKGAAEAIKAEAGTLTKEYIQYLWVRQNKFNDKTTIYIPTEGNLPILEALRLDK